VKLGKNASDTCEVLSRAYGGGAMNMSSVSGWREWFIEGRT